MIDTQKPGIDRLRYSIWKYPLLVYTAAFSLLAVVVFGWFAIFDKSMILSTGDAKVQHYPALVYVGLWGRRLLRNILLYGNSSIPMWDFSIGYGSDALTTFHYYGLGDPLNWLSVITPVEYTEYLYGFLIILRMYIAGIGFYRLCRYFRIKTTVCVFAALLYAFNFYNWYAGTMHIFFLNGPMYLPFLILGIEKIRNREKPFTFILTVFLFTISNFYFAYILILIAVVYILIRYFCQDAPKDIRSFVLLILKFFLFGLLGLCLAAFTLLPILAVYFVSTRSSAQSYLPLLYNFSHYERFIAGFFGHEDNNWHATGYAPLGLVAVFYIFSQRNRHKTQKVLLITFTAFLLFPVFGYIFNGFLYPSNRFGFAYHFLLLFLAAYHFEDILNCTRSEKTKLTAMAGIYLGVSTVLCRIYGNSTQTQMLIFAAILFLIVSQRIIFRENARFKTQSIIAGLSFFSIAVNSFFYYFPSHNNYIASYMDSSKVYETFNTISAAAFKDRLKDTDTFSRLQTAYTDNYSGATVNGVNGTGYYFSYCSDNLPLFQQELELVDFTPYRYNGMDKSAFLNALASVEYYSRPGTGNVPYGYQVAATTSHSGYDYTLYRNEKTLPIGYTYDAVMTKEQFSQLSAVEKREAMMQAVLLDGVTGESTPYTITSQSIPYEIEYSDGITVAKTGIYVRKANSKITLSFAGKENCETYVSIRNLRGENLDAYEIRQVLPDVYAAELESESPITGKLRAYQHFYNNPSNYFYVTLGSDVSSKELALCNKKYRFYNGIHNFTVNLGYREKAQTSASIRFDRMGFYTWDSIQVICQPMDRYTQYVDALSRDTLEDVRLSANRIEGRISLQSDKILCLSVPYSKGWRAYVDGEEVSLCAANIWQMALQLEPGEHTVVLTYATPGFKTGVILSCVGWLALLGYALLTAGQKSPSLSGKKDP